MKKNQFPINKYIRLNISKKWTIKNKIMSKYNE